MTLEYLLKNLPQDTMVDVVPHVNGSVDNGFPNIKGAVADVRKDYMYAIYRDMSVSLDSPGMFNRGVTYVIEVDIRLNKAISRLVKLYCSVSSDNDSLRYKIETSEGKNPTSTNHNLVPYVRTDGVALKYYDDQLIQLKVEPDGCSGVNVGFLIEGITWGDFVSAVKNIKSWCAFRVVKFRCHIDDRKVKCLQDEWALVEIDAVAHMSDDYNLRDIFSHRSNES